ncbi:hypothetical protein B0T24DRAFT_96075 [Lasiosphaeria ovina]|uniref:Rhodopsin domain-containing protein n=1 Tax=Lasiosphaeria ovina TaxID=92902 RepID=A0AAE0JUL0_9PEZI|nr:hypothetical protein B0T24DRAFT_96075 [Lasiosphaeria ovina]
MGLLGPEDTLMGLIGVANNLDEPKPSINKKETILGLIITFLALAWICVSIRLYTRFRVIKSPGWDDLFVFLSLMAMTPGLIAICLETTTGFGEHLVLLTRDQMAGYFRIFYVANAAYCMSTALIKISLLLQYLRLYERGTYLYNVCRSLIIFITLWGFTYSLLAWVPCVPVRQYWDQIYDPMGDRTCYAYGSQRVATFTATYESHAAVNMLLDLLVMGLPIPLYFDKNTHNRTKMGLIGILTFGTIVNIFSIWRFATMIQHKSTTWPTFDPTWYGPISIVMAGLEVSSACICASVPIFWGPMAVSMSKLMGQIFVTNEIHITTARASGSQEGFHKSSSSTSSTAGAGLELQGATLTRQTSEIDVPERHELHAGRVIWPATSEDALVKRYELWAKV